MFVSSHLMSEMALTADHLIVVGRGRLIADTSVEEFTRNAARDSVHGAHRRGGSAAYSAGGSRRDAWPRTARGALVVTGLSGEQIGRIAAEHGIALSELTPQQASLEEAFMELTRDAVEYATAQPVTVGATAGPAPKEMRHEHEHRCLPRPRAAHAARSPRPGF